MIAQLRTAMKFFVYGLTIGILFAPKSGKETRSDLMERGSKLLKDTLGM